MRRLLAALTALMLTASPLARAGEDITSQPLTIPQIALALQNEGIYRGSGSVEAVKALFEHAVGAQLKLQQAGQSSGSEVGQDAVEIAAALDLDARSSAPSVVRAIKALAGAPRAHQPIVRPPPRAEWNQYFNKTAALSSDHNAFQLFARHGFHPVLISWEDIGRYEGSVWGSRISDVGIWGRRDKDDLQSARLMLTVRRDDNFRDKVLMVPSDNIKLHRREDGELKEVTLRQRLRELNLLSPSGRFDKNVIVSNQFSIVPVPQKEHAGVDTLSFNFSIFPYGSTNYVIADTIEGSSELVVGGNQHQLVYFNAHGKKAPFTAARSSDREEIVKAAEQMRAQGLDVDVQRFYLIQIPIRHAAKGVTLANMGAPPMARMQMFNDAFMSFPAGVAKGGPTGAMPPAPSKAERRGLEDVVVGHGKEEGQYFAGAGFAGKRADERVRVTVCYFVTPRGELTGADMSTFAKKFQEWDKKAVWGGSFVVPEQEGVAAK
ncbi:MAG TPA: hypothetical protein VFA20_22135 [Myxococcaceae bacterium]|nr:hypothetical protein [Myxococcaceae bacterium]